MVPRKRRGRQAYVAVEPVCYAAPFLSSAAMDRDIAALDRSVVAMFRGNAVIHRYFAAEMRSIAAMSPDVELPPWDVAAMSGFDNPQPLP